MPNPNGNEASLRKFQPKWYNGTTRTIRVPIVLADQILDYAHKLDESPSQVNQDENSVNVTMNQVVISRDTLTQVLEVLKEIDNSTRFTRQLRAKLSLQVIEPLEAVTQANEDHLEIIEAIEAIKSGNGKVNA